MLGLNLPFDDESTQDSDELIEVLADAAETLDFDELIRTVIDSALETGDLSPGAKMFKNSLSLLKTINELIDIPKKYNDDENVIEKTAEYLLLVEAGIKSFIATLDSEEE